MLLRMTAEKHHVAAKVIATIDDLEQIADGRYRRRSGPARLAARTVRRSQRLALKHGKLALAVEKGRVVQVDRG